MSSLATPPVKTNRVDPYPALDEKTRLKLSEIDQSLRTPLFFFLVSAILWLLAGTVFALLTSVTLTNPYALPNWEWLTFGRIRSTHLAMMAFGWSNNAAFAVGLWIMARLCRSPIRYNKLLLLGGISWNTAITVGMVAILAGDITSVEWLEFPPYLAPWIAISYALIGFWAILCFRYRQTDHVYVSQWYLLAAFFWFPWLYTIAVLTIFFEPATGVVQSLTNWWFAHNVLGLWLTPIALGSVYYFIPKVLGKPVHSYYLSVLGFWALALFYNWAGVHHLIGGPVPVWVVSAGVVASVMMVIPVIVTAINHHLTVVGEHRKVFASPTLRFVVFGAMSYTGSSLFGSWMALRSVNVHTHFTHFTVGHAHHGVYAFFAMVMFGAIYYIMPRLLYREWPSASLIKVHFWFSAIGIGMMVTALQIGGWIQGVQLNALTEDGLPVYTFLEVMDNTVKWLHVRSVSGVLLTVAHVAFAINFFRMLCGKSESSEDSSGPTLLSAEKEA